MVTIREELLDDFISLAEAHLGAVHLVLWLVRPRTNTILATTIPAECREHRGMDV